jgi:zinc transporter 1/2/3
LELPLYVESICTTALYSDQLRFFQGMGVRNSFNLSGHATIYAIGILDSISAGILLYAGIAQLLVGDWLAGEMRTASNAKIAVGAVSLFLGLFAMSLIGKWA